MNAPNEVLIIDNGIIFQALSAIEVVYEVLKDSNCFEITGEKIKVIPKGYYGKIKYLQRLESVEWPRSADTFRQIIRSFLENAEIPLLKENIYKIKNPGVTIADVDPALFADAKIEDLNDTELVHYFALVCRTVTYLQKGDLLLLKYSPVIYETGWNKLALMCRGKVIDTKQVKLITYPFDKFFNLNEVPSTKEALIRKHIETARTVYVSEKMDGTLISVSRYNGKPLITTTGAFDNIYIEIADKLLQQYPDLYNNFPDGYTMLFELICPESRQCVDYGDAKKMILIGIRSHETLNLLSRQDLEDTAKDYGLEIVSQEFLTLDDMKHKINDRNTNKEGWVLRIIQDDGSEQMVKMKYEEYFMLHCMKSGISLKKFYNLYVFENIYEQLKRMTPGTQEAAMSTIEQININRLRIREKAVEMAQECCYRLSIDISEELTRENRKRVYDDFRAIQGPLAAIVPIAVRYIRLKNLDHAFDYIRFEKYQAMVDALDI